MTAAFGAATPLIAEESDGHARIVFTLSGRGLALTLGTVLRRTLLSAIPGAAITSVRIDGVHHEFSVLEHVFEDVPAFISNLQEVRFRAFTDRPARLFLDVRGAQEVRASALEGGTADYEVANPELLLASLVERDAALTADLVVESGRGYRSADAYADPLPVGTIPVDALFSPIRRVRLRVDPESPGACAEERLTLDVWTDCTIGGVDAARAAAELLTGLLTPMASLVALGTSPATPLSSANGLRNGDASAAARCRAPALHIDDLGLSRRVMNALRRAELLSVNDVLAYSERELLSLRHFGAGALAELLGALDAHGMDLR